MHVAIGQSEGIDTQLVAERVLDQCQRQLRGRRPGVGMLFVNGEFDHQYLLDTIAEQFPGMPLIGAHVSAVMDHVHGFREDAMQLMLLCSEQLTMTVGLGRHCNAEAEQAVGQALAMARAGHSEPEVLCLALSDIINTRDPYRVLDCLNQALAPGCPVFGGGATLYGSPGTGLPRSFHYFGRELVHDSLPILLISGPLAYSFSIENSWTPVGARHQIRSSDPRWVEYIGERTALAMYQHYLGKHRKPAYAFPLAVFEAGTGDDRRHYMRAPMDYDRDTGAVFYSGPVPDGATVQLTEAVRTDMIPRTRQSIADAMTLPDDIRPALCLVFSCAGRKQVLGTQTYRECELITGELRARADGGVATPMVGMYAAGELAPLRPGAPSMLHQSTMITLLLGVRGSGQESAAQAGEGDESAAAAATPAAPAATDDPALMARRLARTNARLAELEENRERNHALWRAISQEIEESRRVIADKNRELETLYAEVAREKQKSDDLLLEILPREIAEELKRTGQVEPVFYRSATVLFADFQGFTRLAAALSPRQLLRELDYFFSEFDTICDRHGLEKLKTIGDAYMCAGGIPAKTTTHARDVVMAAWDMQRSMTDINAQRVDAGQQPWALRVGINTGPLMAGVIGNRKFAYDIWGNTVNIAARMESAGEVGRVNISVATHQQVSEHFECTPRGPIAIKNAGEVEMFFVDRPLASAPDTSRS